MYRVLYRKWRPKSFDDVIGQEHITKTLLNEIESGRVSHAYLFVGSRGTGKTTCAKILAKAVNCESGETRPCNSCETCEGIKSGTILDVSEIDAASNNGVENIRMIREESSLSPVSSRYRVYIIDEVHMLSAGAFNALLKTLEEPPSHVIFILATTDPQKLPATILSRCQRFDFKRIPSGKIADRLMMIAGEEEINLEPDGAALIAALSDGAMRDALSILDRIAGAYDTVNEQAVIDCVGIAGTTSIAALVDFMESGDVPGAISLINELHNNSLDLRELCGQLIAYYRNMLLIKTYDLSRDLVVLPDKDYKKAQETAETLSVPHILSRITSAADALDKIRISISPRSTLECEIIRMCISGTEIVDTMSAGVVNNKNSRTAFNTDGVKQKNPAKKADEYIFSDDINPPPAPPLTDEHGFSPPSDHYLSQGDPIKSADTVSSENEEFPLWQNVLASIKNENRVLFSVLADSKAFLRPPHLLIKSENAMFKVLIKQQGNASSIRSAVRAVTGEDYKLGIYKQTAAEEPKKEPLDDLLNKLGESGVSFEVV